MPIYITVTALCAFIGLKSNRLAHIHAHKIVNFKQLHVALFYLNCFNLSCAFFPHQKCKSVILHRRKTPPPPPPPPFSRHFLCRRQDPPPFHTHTPLPRCNTIFERPLIIAANVTTFFIFLQDSMRYKKAVFLQERAGTLCSYKL